MGKIVGVAIRLTNTENGEQVIVSLPKPHRHAHIIHPLSKLGIGASSMYDQGFVTDEGLFLNRVDGGIFAIENKQIKKLEFPKELYSEDLW